MKRALLGLAPPASVPRAWPRSAATERYAKDHGVLDPCSRRADSARGLGDVARRREPRPRDPRRGPRDHAHVTGEVLIRDGPCAGGCGGGGGGGGAPPRVPLAPGPPPTPL